MDYDKSNRRHETVYSEKVKAGRKRTYFFDVRETRGGDYYIVLTESTRRSSGEGYDRHKIFLYKEDFNRFLEGFQKTVDHVKTELMPEYDYDEFTRKHEEYEAQRLAEQAEQEANNAQEEEVTPPPPPPVEEDSSAGDEDDMSW